MNKVYYLAIGLVLLVAIWYRLGLNTSQPETTWHLRVSEGEGQGGRRGESDRAATGGLSGTVRSLPPAAPSEVPGKGVLSRLTRRIRARYDLQSEWRTPIDFYGEVVDEMGSPVADAEVRFVWTDLSSSGASEVQTTSDATGRFALRSRKGKHLSVRVSKAGYHAYQPFGAGFSYAGENQNFVPNATNPVVFRLKRKGVAEPLIHVQGAIVGGKRLRVSRDGLPIEISLTSGEPVPSGQGDVRVECWTYDGGGPARGPYDWTCRISVPGGGIAVSTNNLEFVAPSRGYSVADTIEMPAELKEKWRGYAERRYFVRLRNGNYGRLSFTMIAGGDHFFEIESFLNPAQSRNLEYDEKMVIRP